MLALGRKIKGKTRVGKFLVRYHDYFAYIFLLVACVHMALSLKLLEIRYVTIYATGAGVLLLVVALIIVVFVVAHIGVTVLSLKMYQKRVGEITFSEIDLRKVQNGIYRGEYDVGYISAEVVVTVKDGKFTDIELVEHKTERGKKAEVITEIMLAEQKIDVDAITGATNSSKVIRKSVEEAVKKGCKMNTK